MPGTWNASFKIYMGVRAGGSLRPAREMTSTGACHRHSSSTDGMSSGPGLSLR